MTLTYQQQQKHWASIGYRPPTGPDRCPACSWHVPTQGHVDECPGKETTDG